MKNAKKVFAMLIVLALAISMAIPVSAGTGSIKISNAKKGNTYSIYKIADLAFSGDSDATGKYAYSVASDSLWVSFLSGKGFTLTPSADGATYAIDDPASLDVAQFAKDALDFAKKEGAYKDRTGDVIGATKTAVASGTSVQFTELSLGYYLVDTTVGTICSLGTVNGVGTPDVTIRDKHDVPTIEKKVNGKDLVDAFIGEVVNYTVSVNVKDGAINYKVTDTLTAGLTFKAVTSVKDGDGAVLAAGSALETGKEFEIAGDKDYLFTQNGQTLTFVFDNDKIEDYEGKTIVIKYTATVNPNAVINGANANDVVLSYGNTPNTVDDHVDVYTWDMGILKTDGTVPLSGATFELYQGTKAAGNGVELSGDNGNYTYVKKGTATKFTGGSSFNIKGLKSGTYVLHEVAAPDGYNKLAHDIIIDIDHADGATSVSYSAKIGTENGTFEGNVLEVVNNSGAVLPSTGATGTIIFITVGGLMVVAMGVLLVVRKRMSKVVYTR